MPEAPHLQDPSGDYQTLQEFIPEARKKLNSNTWGYLVGATETETTMRRNRMALDSSPSARASAATCRRWIPRPRS